MKLLTSESGIPCNLLSHSTKVISDVHHPNLELIRLEYSACDQHSDTKDRD